MSASGDDNQLLAWLIWLFGGLRPPTITPTPAPAPAPAPTPDMTIKMDRDSTGGPFGGGDGSTEPGGGDDGGGDRGDSGGTGYPGSGQGSDDEVSLPSFEEFAPDWILSLRALATASVAAGGSEIALSEDPIAYVRAVVSSSLIEAVQIVVGTIASGFLRFLSIFVDAFGSAGSAVLGSFGSVGDVIIAQIDSLNEIIGLLAQSAGPLSPLVVVAIYGGIVVVFAGSIRTVLVWTGFAP